MTLTRYHLFHFTYSNVKKMKVDGGEISNNQTDKTFGAGFMHAVTTTFADELEQLGDRINDTSAVTLLVDALHAGVDIFDNDDNREAQQKWLAEIR